MPDDQLQYFLDMLRNTDDGGVLTDAGVEYGDRDKDDETIFLNIVNINVGTNLPPNGSYEKKITNGDENIQNDDHNYPVRRAIL